MNKYQKSLNYIKNSFIPDLGILSKVELAKPFYKTTKESLNNLKKLVEKEVEYRWHDLRKNPDDLPPNCVDVLLAEDTVDGVKCVVGYLYEYKLHNMQGDGYKWKTQTFVFDKDIIAWRYIEGLEDE